MTPTPEVLAQAKKISLSFYLPPGGRCDCSEELTCQVHYDIALALIEQARELKEQHDLLDDAALRALDLLRAERDAQAREIGRVRAALVAIGLTEIRSSGAWVSADKIRAARAAAQGGT